MRATTVAVVVLFANLIGMGTGPQVVGILSDLLTPVLGKDSLRYAMPIMSLVAFWSAYHFWRVGRTAKEDLSAVANRTQFDANPAGFHGCKRTFVRQRFIEKRKPFAGQCDSPARERNRSSAGFKTILRERSLRQWPETTA